jgi:protease-4
MTIMGSVGVTMAGLSFEEFIEEYNISYRRLTAGEYKDIGSSYRAMTQEEEKIIQNLLDETHSIFINHVAESRELDLEFVKTWSQGQVFSGNKAKELGFIDEVGLYEDALSDLKGDQEVLIIEFGQEPSLLSSLGVESPSLLPRSSLGLLLE